MVLHRARHLVPTNERIRWIYDALPGVSSNRLMVHGVYGVPSSDDKLAAHLVTQVQAAQWPVTAVYGGYEHGPAVACELGATHERIEFLSNTSTASPAVHKRLKAFDNSRGNEIYELRALTHNEEKDEKQRLADQNTAAASSSSWSVPEYWSPTLLERVNVPLAIRPVQPPPPPQSGTAVDHGLLPHVYDMVLKRPGESPMIPVALRPYQDILTAAYHAEAACNPDLHKRYYMYFTADRATVLPGDGARRPGVHGDDFPDGPQLSGLIRRPMDNTYIVSDTAALSTEFFPGPFSLRGFDLACTPPSAILREFDRQALTQQPVQYPPWLMLRLRPYHLHRVKLNDTSKAMIRWFFKVTFSVNRFNRADTTRNPGLPTSWIMVDPAANERRHRTYLVDWQRPDASAFAWVDLTSMTPADLDTFTDGKTYRVQKTTAVFAEPAVAGDVLVTSPGGFDMTYNVAKEGDWKLTSTVDLRDRYFLSDAVFRQLYETTTTSASHVYLPKPNQSLVARRLTKPMRALMHWNAVQYAPAGSYLILRNDWDRTFVHPESFRNHYTIVNTTTPSH